MKFVLGDVSEPVGGGSKIIAHCCNDLGVMQAGVALALAHKWPTVGKEYIYWNEQKILQNDDVSVPFQLGEVQIVTVEEQTVVANMIGQHGIEKNDVDGPFPIRYLALDQCLEKVCIMAKTHYCSVHVPYLMGCGSAGGKWNVVERMLEKNSVEQGILTLIYDKFGKREEHDIITSGVGITQQDAS